MRVLVTGSNGLVGSRLCRLLVQKGHQVVGASRGERRAQGDYEYRSVELTDTAQAFSAVEDYRPEVVVNPASMTEVDGCEKDPEKAYAANVSAPAFLAEACRESGAHLVHVSTDYVFDGERGGYTETDLPNPR